MEPLFQPPNFHLFRIPGAIHITSLFFMFQGSCSPRTQTWSLCLQDHDFSLSHSRSWRHFLPARDIKPLSSSLHSGLEGSGSLFPAWSVFWHVAFGSLGSPWTGHAESGPTPQIARFRTEEESSFGSSLTDNPWPRRRLTKTRSGRSGRGTRAITTIFLDPRYRREPVLWWRHSQKARPLRPDFLYWLHVTFPAAPALPNFVSSRLWPEAEKRRWKMTPKRELLATQLQ